MPGKGARVAIRLIGTPLLLGFVIGLVYLEHQRLQEAEPLFLPLMMMAIGGLTLFEVYRLFRIKGHRPATVAGILAVVFTLARPLTQDTMVLEWVYAALVLYVLAKLVFRYEHFTFVDAGLTLGGFFYVSMLQYIYTAYLYGPNVGWYLLFLLAASKLPDQAGYVIGKTMGRHKMAPVVSPNKTWEGGIAGLIAGVAGGILIGIYTPAFSARFEEGLPWAALIVLCALVTLASMLGDLVKSALKRWAGVKDSGFIPEFGGFLDIVDSFLLSAPIAAAVLAILYARL